MKRVLFIIIALALAAGGAYWGLRPSPANEKGGDKAEAKPEEKAAEELRLKRDDQGRVMVCLDSKAQGNLGLVVAKPAALQLNREVKAAGRVLDPASLSAMANELALAQAAGVASSNELTRLQTLAPQGNAPVRELEKAEAAARHDALALQSAQDRLVLAWGKAVAERADLPAFSRSLATQNSALVRLDWPVGEPLPESPAGARLVTLSGATIPADFLGLASTVEAQTLGRGLLFLAPTNSARLLAGEALLGYIRLPGGPESGVEIPAGAVVRTEGSGWVYVFNSGGASFTRVPVTLDRPTAGGWFLAQGVTATNYIVTTGAQALLSEEMKSLIKAD